MPMRMPNTQATTPPSSVVTRKRSVGSTSMPVATMYLEARAATYAPIASKPQQPSVSWPSTPMVRFSEVVMMMAMHAVIMMPLT